MALLINQNAPDPKWRIWLFISIIFVILFGIAMLSGCVTEKQRAKICATCPSNNTIEVTRKDSTAIKDSLAKIKEKDGGDISFRFGSETGSEKSECDSIRAELARIKAKPVIKHANGVTSSIKTNGKVITFDCKCDSFEIALKKLKIEHWALINSSKEEKIVTNECPEKWKQTTYRYGFWILLPIVLILLGVGIFRGIAWLRRVMP